MPRKNLLNHSPALSRQLHRPISSIFLNCTPDQSVPLQIGDYQGQVPARAQYFPGEVRRAHRSEMIERLQHPKLTFRQPVGGDRFLRASTDASRRARKRDQGVQRSDFFDTALMPGSHDLNSLTLNYIEYSTASLIRQGGHPSLAKRPPYGYTAHVNFPSLVAVLMIVPAPAVLARAHRLQSLPITHCMGDLDAENEPSGGDLYVLPADSTKRQTAVAFWKILGYNEGPAGHLIGRGGWTVDDAFAKWMDEPVNLNHVRVPEALWGELMSQGYRLDERNCSLLAPPAKPNSDDTARDPCRTSSHGKRLSRLCFQIMAVMDRRAAERYSLERLKARLDGYKSAAPGPTTEKGDIRAMINGSPLSRNSPDESVVFRTFLPT